MLHDIEDMSLQDLKRTIEVMSRVVDDVVIVEPVSMHIMNIEGFKLAKSHCECSDVCPLHRDRTGCICKVIMQSPFRKCKFSINGKRAYMTSVKPIRYKGKVYSIVLIQRVDANFAFGTTGTGEGVEEIAKLSSGLVIDPLTGIYNRKYLVDNIDYILENNAKQGFPASLASIDIDNFKRFNDTYGHEFGDKVLQLLANNMKRVQDRNEHCIPVRVGGDEFLVIGDGISEKRLKQEMEKLCINMRESKLKFENEDVGVCVSIGVAGVQEKNTHNYKELYDKADEALYGAKKRGKNCVCTL